MLADVGPPCPRELPAHAHADTLSCVVHVDGAPLLIDTGTSSYAAGPVRDRERSTAAHNTVEVDRRDSTEVWGAFRAGRRARVTGLSARVQGPAVTVEAAHDGYRSLPGRPGHRRRWTVRADEMRVDDELTGNGQAPRHRALAPGAGNRLAARPWRRRGQHRGRRDQHHRDRDKRADRAGRHGAGQRAGSPGRNRRRCSPARSTPSCPPGSAPSGAGPNPVRSKREAACAARQRRPGDAARRAGPGAATDRGARPHALLGDLSRHRARRHGPGAVKPARKGAGKAGPGPAGCAEGPRRGDREHRRAVLGQLARDVPLGYSAAGVVLEAGAAVTGIRPGQLVATGGAGKANHAELQAVPWLLCAPVPAASASRTPRSPRSRRSRCTGCDSPRRARDRR